MGYKEYVDHKKELYDILLKFLDCMADDNVYSYNKLIDILKNQKIIKTQEDSILFLHQLIDISNNHHRSPDFLHKIQQILQYFHDFIKSTFTNTELFNFFKSNKLLILYFIRHGMITINKEIVNLMLFTSQETSTKYHYFFYPEIKDFLDHQELYKIEQEINPYEQNSLIYFDSKRRIGENESNICELIRNDSIDQFIEYANQSNFLLSSTVPSSIFETNQFLLQNEPSLIEYAAFFGSIQIFQFIKNNNIELKPSIWLYAIHGHNLDLIHLLESSRIQPPNCSCTDCISESIERRFEYLRYQFIDKMKSSNMKIANFDMNNNDFYDNNLKQKNDPYHICVNESIICHHNDFANYFLNNFLNDNEIDFELIYKSYNFDQIPNKEPNNSIFYYLCRYDYFEMVNLYLESIELNYNNTKSVKT